MDVKKLSDNVLQVKQKRDEHFRNVKDVENVTLANN